MYFYFLNVSLHLIFHVSFRLSFFIENVLKKFVLGKWTGLNFYNVLEGEFLHIALLNFKNSITFFKIIYPLSRSEPLVLEHAHIHALHTCMHCTHACTHASMCTHAHNLNSPM